MTHSTSDQLVSVIIPTFNRASTIMRAIRSVLDQDYKSLELIVVDDGSTDTTADIVASVIDPRLRFIRLDTNAGASRARNVGLRAAIGDLIAFHDSDDEWLYGKLSTVVREIQFSGGNLAAVFHAKIIHGIDDNLAYGHRRLSYVPHVSADIDSDYLKETILHRNIISPQTLIFTRNCLDSVGYFDECLANSVDWDFAIRLIHSAEVRFLDEPLVMTYTQDSSISRNRRRAMRSQLRIVLKIMRTYDPPSALVAHHLGTIGMAITKLGAPRRGRALLMRAIGLDRGNLKNWLRFAATNVMILAPAALRYRERPA